MSEIKLISPLLDNFMVGEAMSEHHGIRCYPAIEKDTEDKYIIKVISVPASSSQLDALLLSGAYSDRASALEYFRQMADSVLQEVRTLENLSQLEGFIAYTGCQLEPMESGEGFEIYLLSPYKRTLQKHFKRHSFTHLDALNLGLDLCAALSVSRRCGYMCIDIKPDNIFVTDQRLFRIGDLGFVALDSLKYASVPDKYMSIYTPPEVKDAFSSLNETMDIYAAGLILYQTYNNGFLPFNDLVAPGDKLPAPLYADYEIAEIILKACAPDPQDRWQTPTEMGQAIIGYMQRNGAVDTPIIPIPASEIKDPDESRSDEYAETEGDFEAEPDEGSSADADENSANETVTHESEDSDQPVTEEELMQTELDDRPYTDDDGYEEVELEDYETLTEEVSEILEQADQLASLDVPEPVVVPEHVDVPVPELPPEPVEEDVAEETDSGEEVLEDVAEDMSEIEEQQECVDQEDSEEAADDTEESEADTGKKKTRKWIRNAILIFVLLALLAGGIFYYCRYYLVPIEFIAVEGNEDTLTVYVTTDIDESMLRVICSDTYGNQIPAPIINGKAEFTGLVPNMAYNIKVVTDGFHRLTGNSSTAYSTPLQSNIVQFDAVTGSSEDSVILSFTVEGQDCKEWSVVYSAEGEQEQTATFTSHMVTLSNLSVGKEYTFRLVSGDELYVTGQDEIKYTPRSLIRAENLKITGCMDNTLSVAWSVPAGEVVTGWSVHCFSDTYNQTVITTDTSAVFRDLDHTDSYTVDVKAVGMSVSQSVTVSANSVTAANFKIDNSDFNKLVLSWEPTQEITEDGWLLRYSIEGIDNEETIPCNTNAAVITPVIPKAIYHIRLEDSKGNVLLGSDVQYSTAESADFSAEFSGYQVQRSDLTFAMCKTPENPGWGRYDLSDDDYTTEFTVGEKASFLVRLAKQYTGPSTEVTTLYVVRDQSGGIISCTEESVVWKNVLNLKLNIPAMPSVAGSYTMEIYFNGGLAHEQNFSIT